MKLAMGTEGKGFWGDGIELSWPEGGEREVIEVEGAYADLPPRVQERIRHGGIVVVDDSEQTTAEKLYAVNELGAKTTLPVKVTKIDGSIDPAAPTEVEVQRGALYAGGSPEALAILQEPPPELVRARAITTEELVGRTAEEGPVAVEPQPTKKELLAHAKEIGAKVSTRMNVAQIKAAIAEVEPAEPESPAEPEAPAEPTETEPAEPPEGESEDEDAGEEPEKE